MCKPAKVTQYSMAVVLILSSIAIAIYQVMDIDDIAGGVLMYIAQAFLLAGSIFGLDYYIKKLHHEYPVNQDTERNPKQ